MTFVADFSWHAECQRGKGCNPPVFLLWSLPLGQCAAHVSSNWLAVKMWLPWNMSRWSKWGPLTSPSPLTPSSIQAGSTIMFWWVGGEATCLWVRACVHMNIKDEISRERRAFEVKEEVGHVIVQPCVFVCAWVFVLVPDFSANECGRARRLPRTLWCYTNWCLPSLSGFSGVSGNLFMSTSPPLCRNKMREMLFCLKDR